MNQLIFDFASHEYPGFDTFLGTANSELVHVLKEQKSPFVYVWGAEGSGKSHLLRAWADKARQLGHNAAYIEIGAGIFPSDTIETPYLALDQIEFLNSEESALLFALFNRIRNGGLGALLLSSTLPPQHLNLREDLRTRMGYCLVYEVKPLSDDEKINALENLARIRQIPIDPAVFRYLLTHWQRDMNSLLNMLDTLDRYSLAMKKRITLPLLRQLLQQETP